MNWALMSEIYWKIQLYTKKPKKIILLFIVPIYKKLLDEIICIMFYLNVGNSF